MNTLQTSLAARIFVSWLATMALMVAAIWWRHYRKLPSDTPLLRILWVWSRIACYVLFFLAIQLACWASINVAIRCFQAAFIIFVAGYVALHFIRFDHGQPRDWV